MRFFQRPQARPLRRSECRKERPRVGKQERPAFPRLKKKDKYSGDPKSDHSKSGIIRKPDILGVRFQMVNDKMGAILSEPFKIRPSKCSVFKWKTGQFIPIFEW